MRAPSHITALALTAFACPAAAQVQEGDLLVNLFHIQFSSIDVLRPDGTPALSATSEGAFWEGVVLTASGRIATTSRLPNTVRLFDPLGAEVATFEIPQIDLVPGDIDRFADGTLIVTDQGGEIELYDESGAHLGTWTAPSMTHPFALHVDAQDHLWVSDIVEPPTVAGYLFEFERAGTVLATLPLTFEPGDIDSAADGTLWVTDRQNGVAHHLSADGQPLGEFPTGLAGFLNGVAVEPAGTLLFTASAESRVARYTTAGVHLDDIALPGPASPVFVEIAAGLSVGTPYCFGEGPGVACPCGNLGELDAGCANSTLRGAQLAAHGSASLSAASLAFDGSRLVPGQPAQILIGRDTVAGGLGAPFGDGLRCVATDIRRLSALPADVQGNVSWSGPDLAGAGFVAGESRYLQIWYRDPLASPCGTGVNLTNGVAITLAP